MRSIGRCIAGKTSIEMTLAIVGNREWCKLNEGCTLKDTTLKGYWWLPEKENDSVPGLLSIAEDNKVTLDLIGTLEGLDAFSKCKKYPIIWGITYDGKQYTLADCVVTNGVLCTPGFPYQSFSPTSAYAGAHLIDPRNTLFGGLRVEYSHLTAWTCMSGISCEFSMESRDIKQWSATYTPTPEASAQLPDLGNVTLCSIGQMSVDSAHQIAMSEVKRLIFRPAEPMTLEDLDRGFMYPMRNFLSFAAMSSVYPTSVYLSIPGEAGHANENDSDLTEVEVLFRLAGKTSTDVQKGFASMDMLFYLQDVADRFQEVLAKWFSMTRELGTALDAFFAVTQNPMLLLEHRFLNTVQALESYHRCRMNKQVFANEVHADLVRRCACAVSDKYKEWVHNVLRHSNEPTLKHRIVELMNEGTVTMSRIGVKPNRLKRQAQKVVDTRNYLAHRDVSRKKRAAKGKELYAITQLLTYLFREFLLKELSFSDDKISELFSRNQRFLFQTRQIREYFN